MTDRTCSIEDCESPEIALGWCSKHYQRHRRTGDPLGLRKNGAPKTRLAPRPCEHPRCEAEQLALGWCKKHYERTRRTGTPWEYRKMTVEERFFSNVTEDPESGCWIFGRATSSGGYGQFAIKKKNYSAHRWAYEYMVGPIPALLTIDHLCGTRPCVNPWHMDPVPLSVNSSRGSRRRRKLVP